VQRVSVSVSEQYLLNEMTYDLDIWRDGSRLCRSRSSV